MASKPTTAATARRHDWGSDVCHPPPGSRLATGLFPAARVRVVVVPWLIALAQGRGSGPNPLGPFAAALLVLAIGSGWPAVKALFRDGARASRRALVCAGPGLAGRGGGDGRGRERCARRAWPRADQLAHWPGMLDTFLIALLFVALGEAGWRGFLPRLR
ncbi:MAG: hypothetical protein IPH50_08975 [Rhodanobacteraceae bacterium]|nr:hypothetical protein [Rhodanobacteraceae bacterium]